MSFNTIAQAITPPATLQCAALDLYFTSAGGAVLVSVGPLDDAGLPGPAIAQRRIEAAGIVLGGAATRVTWDAPALLQAGTGYAISVAAADTETALAVAQVNELNLAGGGYITAPPAAIGALHHINPAGQVTRHATRALRFDILAANYTANSKTVTLGTQAVENATTLMVNSGAEQPAADARVRYAVELLGAGGAVLRTLAVDAGQPVQLEAPHTGEVRVRATLSVGVNGLGLGLGPVLEPGTLLAVGSLLADGTYVTPAIATAGGSDLRVIFEGSIPAGAAVAVHMQEVGGSDWVPVPYASSSPQTAGAIELTHRLADVTASALRLRLTLSGTATARPQVRNLRAVIL